MNTPNNLNNNSPLYMYFNDFLNTAICFKNLPQSYLTIKQYIFNYVQNLILTNQAQLYQYEQIEIERHMSMFSQEINSYGQNNAYLNKEGFENFVIQCFSRIDFSNSDIPTLNIANNLLTVLTIYGELSEKFANQRSFINNKLQQLRGNNTLNNNYNNNNINSLNKNVINNSNQNINNPNNQGSNKNSISPSITNKLDSSPIVNNGQGNSIKNDEIYQKNLGTISSNIGIPKGNFTSDDLIKKNIKLPIKKGTLEYENIKALIKEHIMYAEQEALYLKIENSKAHMETALYYLNNIIE